jgi:DNA-binding MarR family transcriptional regulator
MPAQQERIPLLPLLARAKEQVVDELHTRLEDEGYGDIRPGHGCVFGFIEREGSRLTDLAEHARFTKQAVGEVVTDLERLGYLERVPDPADGRAKLIRLTDRGRAALDAGNRIFAEIEARWAEELGEERIASLRETLELIVAREREPAAA